MSLERLYDEIAKFEKKIKAAKPEKPDPKKPAAKADPNEEKKKKRAMSDLEDLQDEMKILIDEKAKLTKLSTAVSKMKPEDLQKFKDAIQSWRDKNNKMVTDALRASKVFSSLEDNKEKDYWRMANFLANSPGGMLEFDDPA